MSSTPIPVSSIATPATSSGPTPTQSPHRCQLTPPLDAHASVSPFSHASTPNPMNVQTLTKNGNFSTEVTTETGASDPHSIQVRTASAAARSGLIAIDSEDDSASTDSVYADADSTASASSIGRGDTPLVFPLPPPLALEQRTPNVYINGLPAHFPEDRLFVLCAPFGSVKSVRTFTRHVGERPSGYGFVLFDTMQSAEKCIESLRRYRNLHPSLSKQVHKIPGTPYLQSTGTDGSVSSSDFGGERREGEDRESFRARMERLHDTSSTNLYIEGLPLSIDEPTLAALVSPYMIKSSRFFQTKLSHPPRIIAFVRLDTRRAAEEIIERLHGRMVRGWNDTGSRISVRFADTTEQRELRRTERSTSEGEGEGSPSRMTIAQAALLNMRGQELQHKPSRVPHMAADLSSSHDFEFVQAHARQLPSARMPEPVYRPYTQGADVDRDMALLLKSLRGRAQYHAGETDYVNHTRAQAAAQLLQSQSATLQSTQSMHAMFPQPSTTLAQGHNGYTPTEELVFRAHASAQAALAQGQGRSRPGPAVHRVQPNPAAVPFTPHSFLPQMSTAEEDEFHAAAGTQHPSLYHYVHREERSAQDARKNSTAARERDEIYDAHSTRTAHLRHSLDSYPLQHQKQQHYSSTQSNLPQNQGLQSSSHTRSTTLPHPSSQSTGRHSSGIQHSISIPSKSIHKDNNNYYNHPEHDGNMFNHDLRHNSSNASSNTITRRNDNNDRKQQQCQTYDDEHYRRASHIFSGDADTFDADTPSPALTYSSRTPSTLSPATPFFGSFGHVSETFEGSGIAAKKLRAGSQ